MIHAYKLKYIILLFLFREIGKTLNPRRRKTYPLPRTVVQVTVDLVSEGARPASDIVLPGQTDVVRPTEHPRG